MMGHEESWIETGLVHWDAVPPTACGGGGGGVEVKF